MQDQQSEGVVGNRFAAEILESSASGYASAAAGRLLDDRPEVEEHFAPGSAEAWKKHYTQRILELASAVASGEPNLFAERVAWSRQAFEARGFDTNDLAASLQSLRSVLLEKLPEAAAGGVAECIDAAVAKLAEAPPDSESQLDPRRPHHRVALLYLQSVLEGNLRPAMECVFDAVEGGVSTRDALVNILLPAQSEVGRLWHLDQVSVAEEHLVTSTTQRLMATLVERSPRAPDNGKTAVAASVAGNVHDMGIRAIAYLLELNGWRTIFLGADVPRGDLPACAQFYSADLVLLSCALSVQLRSLRDSVNDIKKRCEQPPKIMVGGMAFSAAPQAWESVGADGYAGGIDEALALAAELVNQST